MDKYEYKLSLTEIKRLVNERRFPEAAAVADTVDWKRVKTPETLCLISDIYKMIKEYEKSRALLVYANARRPGDPNIVYSLCELTIFLYGQQSRADYLMAALQLVKEYQSLEPDNPKRLILQYKMYNVSPVSMNEKIVLLEQLKKEAYSARWGYELAQLYKADGQTEKAAAQYRDIIVRFAGTKYAEAAQDALSELSAAPEEDFDDDSDMTIAGKETVKVESKAMEAAVEKAEADTEAALKEAVTEIASKETAERIEELPVPAPEEEAEVENVRKTVERGMRNIYSAPYDTRISQESSGQYKMIMDETAKPEPQIEGQMSIGEVMDEWEKIRRSIRSANDKKRAMRILEDTGPLLQDFDNNAKHGLLEDIEKGIDRQRRSARSSLAKENLRDYEPSYREEPVRGRRESEYYERDERRDRYDEPAYREPEYDEPAYREPEYDEPAYREPEYEEPVYKEPAYEEPAYEEPSYEEPEEDEPEQEEPVYEEPVKEEEPEEQPVQKEAYTAPRVSLYEESEQDDDGYAEDGASTRRWNSEEVKRAMERQQARVAAAQAELDAEAAIRNAREAEKAAYGDYGQLSSARRARYDQIDEAVEMAREEVRPAEKYVERAYTAPVKEEPAYQEPAYKEPVYEKPVYDEPAYDEPAYKEEPAYEEPAYDEEPAYKEEPVYEEPAYKEPEYKEPEYKEPEYEEPAYKEEPVYSEPEKAAPADEDKEQEAEEKPASVGTRKLSKDEFRTFGPFSRVKENRQQLVSALDKISLASHTGNLIITGQEQAAQRVAQSLLEIVKKGDQNFTGKIAKASAESLNKLNSERLSATLKKIDNGALIVSNAAQMTDATVEILHKELDGRSGGLIVILCDVRKNWDQFAARHNKELSSFNASIDIKPLPDKAMVQYAKDYAKSREYSIDEFGEMALRAKISSMQTPSHHVSLKEVREIVDDAIAHASKGPGSIFNRLGGKYKDEEGRIILHEKDFAQYK